MPWPNSWGIFLVHHYTPEINMAYTPRHFAPWEVLPHLTADITWDTLDPAERAKISDAILETGDDIRDLLGPVTVNNYVTGGQREYCGVREPSCPQYSPTSRHAVVPGVRPAGALDLHPANCTADEGRAKIREAVAAGKLLHLGGIELNVTWVHIDDRPRHPNGTLVEFIAT